jgi:hypothetical protein
MVEGMAYNFRDCNPGQILLPASNLDDRLRRSNPAMMLDIRGAASGLKPPLSPTSWPLPLSTKMLPLRHRPGTQRSSEENRAEKA